MDLRDFIVAPITILLAYGFAYWIRPKVCDSTNYKYFFPALSVKIIGALGLGLVYQFYYKGGDTYNYHTFGSRVIWETFMNNPTAGIQVFLHANDASLYEYFSRIIFYHDASSFAVVRIAFLFDLVTLSSYCGTAVWFAFFSFFGVWFLFRTFYELYPKLHRTMAIACLFVPSVFFWGSGILKDTLTIGCLGFATFFVKRIFFNKEFNLISMLFLVGSLMMAFTIKKYVLLCFVPAALFWIYAGNLSQIRSVVLRFLLLPLIIVGTALSGFYAIQKIGADDERYALSKIAKTAQITAYDIRYYTGRDAGSGYSLGELDGTFGSMLRLAPQAINVTLFRPYIWEVKNVLMLLSSLESMFLLVVTLFLLLRTPQSFFRALGNPEILFCTVFAVTFAFAVGVSTYNFGTLVRYKIPMMPFYLAGLAIIADQLKREKKFAEFETTE